MTVCTVVFIKGHPLETPGKCFENRFLDYILISSELVCLSRGPGICILVRPHR